MFRQEVFGKMEKTNRERIDKYLDMLEEDELFDAYFNTSGWNGIGKFDGFEQGIIDILRTVDGLNCRCKNLQKELDKLKDEKWSDKTLKDLREKLQRAYADMNRGFEITEEEDAKIKYWIREHMADRHRSVSEDDITYGAGAIGGRFSYEFIPTGIGTIGTIKCSCGESYTFRGLK